MENLIYALYFYVKEKIYEQKSSRQPKPIKITLERHYVNSEEMETIFKRIAEEQITKKSGK